MKAPFPWFGGKSKVAAQVWAALGDVNNYVEPFAGSLAVLLSRPAKHTGAIETVNDLDHYIVNFWRALQHDPEAVAHHANNPVNEADLTARHIWLVHEGKERIARTLGDPDYYDVRVAGWWVWGIACWIGSGWCAGNGPWGSVDGQLVHLSDAGQGVNRQLVHTGNMGINRRPIHNGADSDGINTGAAEIFAYLNKLAERLRYVRVCCGDWSRVVTRGALSHGSTIGVFLDPPYDTDIRDDTIYNTDADHGHISADVRAWCIENQDNPRYRIVLAGYEGEHEMPEAWRVVEWSAGASYQTHNSSGGNAENRHKERLWLSPHCLGRKKQLYMF